MEDQYFDDEASNDFKNNQKLHPEEEIDPLDAYMKNLEKAIKEPSNLQNQQVS